MALFCWDLSFPVLRVDNFFTPNSYTNYSIETQFLMPQCDHAVNSCFGAVWS